MVSTYPIPEPRCHRCLAPSDGEFLVNGGKWPLSTCPECVAHIRALGIEVTPIREGRPVSAVSRGVPGGWRTGGTPGRFSQSGATCDYESSAAPATGEAVGLD